MILDVYIDPHSYPNAEITKVTICRNLVVDPERRYMDELLIRRNVPVEYVTWIKPEKPELG